MSAKAIQGLSNKPMLDLTPYSEKREEVGEAVEKFLH